jgi:hypothetical protein
MRKSHPVRPKRRVADDGVKRGVSTAAVRNRAPVAVWKRDALLAEDVPVHVLQCPMMMFIDSPVIVGEELQ